MINSMLIKDNNITKWLIFTGVSCLCMLCMVDLSIINLVMPKIAIYFHANLNQVQWVLTSYMLVGVSLMIFCGRLADIFGKKIIFMMGSMAFCLGSIVAAMAINTEMLAVGRALQGLGYGAAYALGILIVCEIFPSEKRGRILGLYTLLAGISQVAGPPVGGLILQYANWRWIFVINIPLCLASLYLIGRYYVQEKPEAHGENIDFIGFVFLSMALSILLLILNQLGHWGFLDWKIFVAVAITIIFMALFYIREKFIKYPLIEFKALNNHDYLAMLLYRGLMATCWSLIAFIIPMYLQNIMSVSPLETAMLMLLIPLNFAIFSPFVGRLCDSVGFKWPVFIAAVLMVVTMIFFLAIDTKINLIIITLCLVLLGLNTAFAASGSVGLTSKSLPKKYSSVGMNIFYMILIFGCAAGIAISGSLIKYKSTKVMLTMVKSHNAFLSSSQLEFLRYAVTGTGSLSTLKPYLPIIKTSFVSGMHWAGIFGLICSICATIICILILVEK